MHWFDGAPSENDLIFNVGDLFSDDKLSSLPRTSRVCPWCWMTRTVTSDGRTRRTVTCVWAEDKDRDPGQGQPAPAREDTRSGRSSLAQSNPHLANIITSWWTLGCHLNCWSHCQWTTGRGAWPGSPRSPQSSPGPCPWCLSEHRGCGIFCWVSTVCLRPPHSCHHWSHDPESHLCRRLSATLSSDLLVSGWPGLAGDVTRAMGLTSWHHTWPRPPHGTNTEMLKTWEVLS